MQIMWKLETEILTKTLIKPSTPTTYNRRKLHLSLFDQLSPKIYVTIIYYYSGDGPAAGRCALLEKSLSEALVQLYPFAGRFVKHDVMIDCGDQGVEFRQARVNCKLSEFLKRAPDEIELVDKLLPWDTPPPVESDTSPQLAVQANAFEDGGIVLGVRISHILADAATMSLLMETWAAACRRRKGVGTLVPAPNFPGFRHEIADVFPARSLSLGFKLNHPIRDHSDTIVTKRFLISSGFLTRIKHGAATRFTGRLPSRVVVALALVWKGLISLSMVKPGNFRGSALSIPMNLRGKLSPFLMKNPKKAFGNFFLSVIVSLRADDNEVDLYDVINLLSKKIGDMSAKVSWASKDELVALLMESKKQVMEKWNENDGEDVYFCSSWYGALPIYETDFGWGKPIWGSISTQPGPGVCLMDSSCGDGAMELWVSLKKTQMVEFMQFFCNLVSFSNL